MRFVAIDFETLDYPRESACALGVVEVHDGRVVGRHRWLMCPPSVRRRFGWSGCPATSVLRRQRTFREIWPSLRRILGRADFVAAHNAPFDVSVLRESCRVAEVDFPALRVVCTRLLATRLLRLQRARLPDVCRALAIPLNHHEPLSDAEACARIVMDVGARRARLHARRVRR